MNKSTTPRRSTEPCRHCRGTGTSRTWARPDLGPSYSDGESCGYCHFGEATVHHCPVETLGAGACDLPLLLMPHLGTQRDGYLVSVLGCPDGHRYERTWNPAGEQVWTRAEDADVLSLGVAS